MMESQARESEKVILVVEDEPSIAEMLQNVLEDEGYRVILAENGQAGLLQLAKFGSTIRLIISDLMMPVMDGPNMLRQIQASPTYRQLKIPVIIMSASVILPDLSGLVYAKLLSKPFDFDTLIETITNLLSIK